MIRPSNPVRHPVFLTLRLAVSAVLIVGCTSEPSSPAPSGSLAPRESRAATSGVTVTSASPDSAKRDTTLDVTIAGSGFATDAVASWGQGGITDPTQVRTNSTHYVNPNKLVANITISSTATIGSWDVIVTTGKKTGIGSDAFAVKPTIPSDTWKLPLSDAGLSLKSDRQYSDGTNSVYAAGVCNVTGTIFTGMDGGTNNSGDATIQTSAASHGRCGRVITLAYPDGVTETLISFANLNQLESTAFSIPIGASATRRLVINPGVLSSRTRCGRVVFGVGPLGDVGIGTDSVLVTRIDASTWQVQSKPAPSDLALCESRNQLYHMRVSFLVVSSHPVP